MVSPASKELTKFNCKNGCVQSTNVQKRICHAWLDVKVAENVLALKKVINLLISLIKSNCFLSNFNQSDVRFSSDLKYLFVH